MTPILIVENDQEISEEIADLLRDEGFLAVTAENGLDALNWLRAGNKTFLILLDLMMPVMSGWEFRSQQLQDPALAGIPVILLSGAAELGRKAESLHAAGYLRKPFTLDALFDVAKRHSKTLAQESRS